MKIWRVHELGEPLAAMRLEDTAPPSARPGEVVLDVEACGLNFPDLLQIRGGYQVKPQLPFTPGGEIAGIVRSVGDGVDPALVGTRTLVMGRAGLAEQTVSSAAALLPIPESMPSAKAAAMPTNYGTNWFALVNRAKLASGETMLVHAGAGGVGSSAIQLGKALGATVFATAGGPEKKAVLERLGVDCAIDYLNEDFVEIVKERTDGKGVDVIYDPVGGDTFDRSRKVIAWDGRMLIIGFTSGRIADVPTNHILLKNYSVVGVHWGASLARDPSSARRGHDALCDLWNRGLIDPLIMAELPIEDAAIALDRLGRRESWGKLVVCPNRSGS